MISKNSYVCLGVWVSNILKNGSEKILVSCMIVMITAEIRSSATLCEAIVEKKYLSRDSKHA